jgi:hypothetical protein
MQRYVKELGLGRRGHESKTIVYNTIVESIMVN